MARQLRLEALADSVDVCRAVEDAAWILRASRDAKAALGQIDEALAAHGLTLCVGGASCGAMGARAKPAAKKEKPAKKAAAK